MIHKFKVGAIIPGIRGLVKPLHSPQALLALRLGRNALSPLK
jgi:hypothetical protein